MLLESLGEKWTNIVNSTGHLKGYPLVDNPAEILGLLTMYYLFVSRLGPYLMRNKPPFDLRVTIMAYNLFQMLLNALLLAITISEMIRVRISPICAEHDPSPEGRFMAKLVFCYLLLKILDMADTIFFVLRKKNNQVTFLHLYHHLSMVLGSWMFCKWYPGGHVVWVGPLNNFTHFVMYFYYFLTAWNPEYKEHIWLKKGITHLQLTQHVILLVLEAMPLFHAGCNYPRIFSEMGIIQATMMIVLFGNFYMKTYCKKPRKAD